MVAFGAVGLISALLLFPLRETLHQPLLEKIEEDDKRIKKSMQVEKVNESEEWITASMPKFHSENE